MKTLRRLLVVLTILTTIAPAAGPALAGAPTKPQPKPSPRAPARAAAEPHPSPLAVIPGPNDNPLPDPLGVDGGILIDVSNGKVLWASNDTLPRPPASLTKILTALVVLRYGKLDDTQPITEDAYEAPGAKTYASAGWTYSVEDLLWGLLLASGNDMAIALAHKVSPDGTVAGFLDLMNKEAAAFGATSTHVANPHGMDAPGHLSTARDMALLTLAAMKNPTFAQMVGTVRHKLPWDGGVHEHLLINHNRLLGLYPGTIGVKTGYTNGSGNSLASEVTRDGTTLLAVVLGAKSPAGYRDSMSLYDWGFANLAALEARSTETITPASPPLLQRAAAPSRNTNVGPKVGPNVGPNVGKGGEAPIMVAQLPEGHPVSDHRDLPADRVLMGLVILSAFTAWYLGRRRRATSP